MVLEAFEIRPKCEFLNKWNEQVERVVDQGIVWIDKDLIWERFCTFNDINANSPNEVSALDLEKLSDLNDKKLFDEILLIFNSITKEII